MNYSETFLQDKIPTLPEISRFIGSPVWDDLNSTLQERYAVKPLTQYSSCSMQRGWNVKYKKSGKALCTLYPMEGFFIALVVLGDKHQGATEAILPLCQTKIKEQYQKTPSSLGGKWLMIEVKNKTDAEDVQRLISVRAGK